MSSLDRTFKLLVDLGAPGARQTRMELIDRALQTALAIVDADAAALLMPAAARCDRTVLYTGNPLAASLPASADGSAVVRVLEENPEPVVLDELNTNPAFLASDSCPGVTPGPAMFVAVRWRAGAPAYLALYRRQGRARYALAETRSMLMLSAWLGASLAGQKLTGGAQKLALTDPALDVYNHRYLRQALAREVRRAGRFGQELSLLTIAFDHTATAGLDASARRGRFRELAELLARQVRSFDVLAVRNEELTVILPQTSGEGAIEAAERMRSAVEARAFPGAEPGAVTVSVGVTCFPREATTMSDLLAAGRRVLEHARSLGGNRAEARTSERDGVFRLAPVQPMDRPGAPRARSK